MDKKRFFNHSFNYHYNLINRNVILEQVKIIRK